MTETARLEIVVAVASNGVIGRGNDLPWRLPADLAHFKRLTLGHPILMGRKTWDSLGRPLPGRRNLVLSRQADLNLTGAEVVTSLEAAQALVGPGSLMVIGGAELYRIALPAVTIMHLTTVHSDVDGDVSFPPWSPSDWIEISAEAHDIDERHQYAYTFRTLVRRDSSVAP
jgi:dihydrofolate reductase